jgi:hypothetical protein
MRWPARGLGVLSAVTIGNAVLCPVDDHPVPEP